MARGWEKALFWGEEVTDDDWKGNQVTVLILLKEEQHEKTSSLVYILSKFHAFHKFSLLRYFSYSFDNLRLSVGVNS